MKKGAMSILSAAPRRGRECVRMQCCYDTLWLETAC
jgi:hypothetical protein